MSIESKQRPSRLYFTTDSKGNRIFYVYDKGQKKLIKGIPKNLSFAKAQEYIINKLHSTIKSEPSKISRTERIYSFPKQKTKSLGRPESSTESRDEGLIAASRQKTKEQRRTDIEKKIIEKKELNKEEQEEKDRLAEEQKLLLQQQLQVQQEQKTLLQQIINPPLFQVPPTVPAQPLQVSEAASQIARHNAKMRQQARENEVLAEIRKHGLTKKDIPTFKLWNGINNSNVEITRTFARAVDRLYQLNDNELEAISRSDPVFRYNNSDDRVRTIRKILHSLTPQRYVVLLNRNLLSSGGGLVLGNLNNPGRIGHGADDNATKDKVKKLPALYDDEIEDFFDDEKAYPNFAGVISSDEVSKLPKKLPEGFIMNLDPSTKPGSHWVACYISNSSVEYFDPLAQPPSKKFVTDIYKHLTDMKVPNLLKLKINNIQQQNANSHRCGYHAIRFLDDRFHGVPFPLSTRYAPSSSNSSHIINNSKEGEGKVKKEFDYI